jgi:TRAP-type C4-dicarboxylate transport system permease small subunit
MERFFRYTLTFLLSSVAFMQFIQVIWRYILQAPLMGLDEILVYPTLWLYFAGSMNASREDTQIKANVLDVFLKTERSRLVVRIIADVCSLVIALWLTRWAWFYCKYAFRVWKESPTLYVPTFYAECSLFIGLVVMSMYAAYHLIRNLRCLTSHLSECTTDPPVIKGEI